MSDWIFCQRPATFRSYDLDLQEYFQLYGNYQDVYFWFQRQRIFLSKLGFNFLNFPNNWSYFLQDYLILYPFESGSFDLSTQFFIDTPNITRSFEFFYVPFNNLTNDLVFNAAAASIRTAANTVTQILECGNEIISYCKDGGEAGSFTSALPVTINGVTKNRPNKQGIPQNAPGIYFLNQNAAGLSQFIETLIIYPLGYLDKVLISISDSARFVSYTQDFPINGNFEFFELKLAHGCDWKNVNTFSMQMFPSNILIDVLFMSSIPLVGLDNVYCFNQGYNYKLVNKNALLSGRVTRDPPVTGDVVIVDDNSQFFYYQETDNFFYQIVQNTTAITPSGFPDVIFPDKYFTQTCNPDGSINFIYDMSAGDAAPGLANNKMWFQFSNIQENKQYAIPINDFNLFITSNYLESRFDSKRSLNIDQTNPLVIVPYTTFGVPKKQYAKDPQLQLFNFSVCTDNTNEIRLPNDFLSDYNLNIALASIFISSDYTNPQNKLVDSNPLTKQVKIFKGFENQYWFYRVNFSNCFILQLPIFNILNDFTDISIGLGELWESNQTFSFINPFYQNFKDVSLFAFFEFDPQQAIINSCFEFSSDCTKKLYGSNIPMAIYTSSGKKYFTFQKIYNLLNFKIFYKKFNNSIQASNSVPVQIYLLLK